MAAINIQTAVNVSPQCYAYTTPGVPAHDGWTKIGFTERDVNKRIKEQTYTVGIDYKICWNMRPVYLTKPYGSFKDTDFHAYLEKLGFARDGKTEWFQIEPDEARKRFVEFTQNHGIVPTDDTDATIPYILRDEQNQAVEQALAYFNTHLEGEFLWNAKPRFGKTLSAYDLCMRLKARNILIVTNRPVIANSWYSDYSKFFGPNSGYLFVSNVDSIKDEKYVLSRQKYLDRMEYENVEGCIEFVSLQDLKGSIYFGGQYDKLAEISSEKGIEWDVMIVDEAHEGVDTYKTDTAFNHIKRKCTLHLSGTPFKALANDKFPECAIYNWTYADEQKKKRDWNSSSESENPYADLPCLNLFTYKMSDIVRDKVKRGIELADNNIEEYAFDLNEFFKTNESGKFVYDLQVDKFLDSLTKQDNFPFSTPELRDELKHTFWLLNRVASARALAKKLRLHPVFKDYEIILAAGDGKIDDDDENEKAFDRVTEALSQYEKTITLSVGQLTTGVTIPEWTAVIMLSNMASPALYMQAAFRAQNPCLFHDSQENSYRKINSYIFDFDPARTLRIYEQFANDLIPDTSNYRGDVDQRKQHVRELLNFFPVYAEDDYGTMIELDAESVLSIPRHIHAKEVVERGFMSNFLFANISGIFGAPKEIIDIIDGMQAIEEPRPLSPCGVNDQTAEALNINENGEVEISREKVIGIANDLFGEKIYGDVDDILLGATTKIIENAEIARKPKEIELKLKELCERFSKPVADKFMDSAQEYYGRDLKKSTRKLLERKIRETTDTVVKREYGDYVIRDCQLSKECAEKISEAQKTGASMTEISKLDTEYTNRRMQGYNDMVGNIQKKLSDEKMKIGETIVNTVKTEECNDQKKLIEGNIRDHLRGFTRTIPAFLMAYGNEGTTLANFDELVPADVFWEVTVNPKSGEGVTLDQFRMLRDGGDYYQKDENGREIRDDEHKKHFDGHLFDEVVFNDAVIEFMKKRAEIADYFDESVTEDIFDYIPPQKTNQIFTPKRVVKDMVDRLERENPGCFDSPDNKFADLYMKSGMYITEIVTRLYQSKRMKLLLPNANERLNHIFAKQVYGCAPTEIIYRICLSYILGFSENSEKIHIDKHNIKLCDTLKYVKEGILEGQMKELFNL